MTLQEKLSAAIRDVPDFPKPGILFKDISKGRTIYFHRDEKGKIWLNLDYTAHYPGGPFLGEEVLSILDLQN
jgi:hypothetical protein